MADEKESGVITSLHDCRKNKEKIKYREFSFKNSNVKDLISLSTFKLHKEQIKCITKKL